jgi:hypothetical protein
MAKLKARGNEIIFRVSKSKSGSDDGVAEAVHYRALRSDGYLLERLVLKYTLEEIAKNYGKKFHDYGWKVRGRAKSGKTLEELLKIYLDSDWTLEDASESYFRQAGPDGIEAISQEPFISEASAEKRKKHLATSRTKAEAKRQERARTNDGPGFYVTNNYTGGVTRSRVADHERPFETYEAAEEFAVRRLRHLTVEFDFQYLLPVVVIEAESRHAAEQNDGHVWWVDGKFRGPAVDPRQTGFGF